MGEKKIRIGLVLDYVVSEYSELIVSGIRKACKNNKIEFLIFPIGELHDIRSLFDYQNVAVTAFLSSKNLDGVIFVSGTQMHYLTKAEITSYIKSFSPLPIVNISTAIPGIPSITVESQNAYKQIIDNLINIQGCKKFGVLGVRSNSNEAKSRRNAIKSILEEYEIPAENITFWKADFEYRIAYEELEFHYETYKNFDFDAIFCLNDEMAFAAMDFCAKIGKAVPDDVCLVGFDDLERSEFCNPSLTTINQQIEEQGYKAVETLLNVIQGNEVPPVTVVEAQPVFRESTSRSVEYLHKSDDIHSKYSGTEWYTKKDQLAQISRYYSEMQYDHSLDQLQLRINSDIRSFGITACAIVLYEKPVEMTTPFEYFNLPHRATVYAAFDDTINYDSSKFNETFTFNPKTEMLPDGIIKIDSEGELVISLFHNTLQYGYMIMRRGNYDVAFYDLFVKMLATIISSNYSLSLAYNETKKYQSQFDKMDIIASTDELTGLRNRRGLYEVGQETIRLAEKLGQSGIIIYSDMDGLKKINDNFGHEEGDRAILAESIILKGNFRHNDIIARIGGDEFAIICPGLTDEALERIQEQIDRDCDIWTQGNNAGFTLSISMGAVHYPSDRVGYQITPLLSEADSLMYLEKRKKKQRIAAMGKLEKV